MKIPSQIMDTGGDVYNWGGRVLLFLSEVPGVGRGILKTLWKKIIFYKIWYFFLLFKLFRVLNTPRQHALDWKYIYERRLPLGGCSIRILQIWNIHLVICSLLPLIFISLNITNIYSHNLKDPELIDN